MHVRKTIAIGVAAAGFLAMGIGTAQADHTKGKKYLDVELTREAAIAADDGFGIAPEGTAGSGAMYLNHGQERFCLFLDFETPDDVDIIAMHLHEKSAEDNPQTGPVVIDASPLLRDEDGALLFDEDGDQISRGCVSGDREFLRGVLSEPDEYYVNAHTSDGLTVIRANIGQN